MHYSLNLTQLLSSILLVVLLASCDSSENDRQSRNIQAINTVMDNWHHAAASANAHDYFDTLNNDAIFIGTDASENWTKQAFFQWSKIYFSQGKAWTFKALERNIYFYHDGNLAWFDELLETQNLGICRGSGVLKKTKTGWKIAHYVLSITSPNETVDQVIKLNQPFEQAIKQKFNLSN